MEGGTRKQACLPIDCLCLESPDLQGKKDLLAEALAKLGRTRCSLIYEKRELASIAPQVAFDPFRLKLFNRLHREPLQLLSFSKQSVKSLDAALQKPGLEAIGAALEQSARWLDHPINPQSPQLTPDATAPLAAAVIQLSKDHGGTPDTAAIQQDASDVPLALQKQLATIILAISAAARARNNALAEPKRANYYFERAANMLLISAKRFSLGDSANPSAEYWALARDFKYKVLYQGAWELSAAIAAAGLKADASYTGFSFTQKTPLGRIILRDNANHTYSPNDPAFQGDVALLVDTGGDDRYEIQAGANASVNNPVSVLLDLAGKDVYGYVERPHAYDRGKRFPSDDGGRYQAPNFCDEKSDCGLTRPCVNSACQKVCKADADCGSGNTCTAGGYCSNLVRATGPVSLSDRARQGGGRLGIAFLIDLGSEADEYRSLRMSQGFGALGVGVLYDAGGDDKYQCEAGCQGSGIFGIGLLLDRAGSDRYLTYTFAQGFGFSRGAGILLDQEGDDQYLANHGDRNKEVADGKKGDPIYLSAQLPGVANSSFVQGAAFGRRADTSDRLYMSGGIGILRDLKGKDAYVCGVFGQGAAYWFGTGILADADGNDKYDGFWYVQGATAHFALSVLLEGSGDDQYNTFLTPRATHTGVGHDFSTSWLVDDSGNDTYNAAGLSLGAGNDNGYGFLIDNDGTDSYTSTRNNNLGVAQSPNPDTNPRNTAKIRTLGIFIDANGTDTYKRPDMTLPANDKLWLQGRAKDGTPRRSLEHGAGVDQSGTSTLSTK